VLAVLRALRMLKVVRMVHITVAEGR
jgi:hypothetical protein